jgi:hypothetical protein
MRFQPPRNSIPEHLGAAARARPPKARHAPDYPQADAGAATIGTFTAWNREP